MALGINYTDEFGATHTDCYCRIDRIETRYGHAISEERNLDECHITVAFYHNAASRLAFKQPLKVQTFGLYEFSSKDLKTYDSLRNALYLYLKTLSAFTTAIDN